jgi:hypothetical protein
MIAVVRGWGVSGHEWLGRAERRCARFRDQLRRWEIGRKQEGVGHAHGEVFIELGFVACDVCDAVACFYFLG